jgi:hypothetical protein
MTTPFPDRGVEATIVGPSGIGPFRWYASYTNGIMKCEGGSHAFTRRGIERRARRVIRRLERQNARWANATTLR